MTVTQPNTKPNRHPWSVYFWSDHESGRMAKELILPIAEGMVAAGAVLQDVNRGRPITRAGSYHVEVDGRVWRFRLRPYSSLRWLWRIYLDVRTFDNTELTFLDSEVTPELGRGFAHMLRAMAGGSRPVWPLFGHWNSFPQYAWTVESYARYKSWWEYVEARRKQAQLRRGLESNPNPERPGT